MQPPRANARIWPLIWHHRGAFLLGLLMTLLTVAVTIGMPFISRYIIDSLIEGVLTVPRLLGLLSSYLAAALFGGWLSFWMRRLPLMAGHLVETEIRKQVFDKLTRMDRHYHSRQHTGDLLNRMSSDIRTIAMAIGQGFLQIGRMVLVCTLGYAVMFVICPPLAAVLLIMTPLMAFSFSRVARRVKKAHVAVQEELSEMARFSQESFTGIQAVKSFAVEPRWRDLFASLNETLLGKNMELARRHEAIGPLAALWFAIGSAFILIIGGLYVIRGRLTLGELVQFNQYLLYMQWPLLSLGWIVGLQQRGRASWARVAEILDSVPQVADGPRTAASITSARGDIRFEQVAFIQDDTAVLDGINLHIPEGARVGLTGPTGSGKTTLISLIPRLIDPTTGRILLGGRPLAEIPLAVLRTSIGMAEQETMLFSDTIARNLAFGREQMTPEQVFAAADIAHLRGDVEQFPRQFDTLVGERGVTLSGGQRQRTAIGRAIARDPRILILDDVLASVDTATEAAILENLRPVFAGRTVLMVSHRITALRDMDFIVVIESGRITQQGRHGELIQQHGYYRRLHEIQELSSAMA